MINRLKSIINIYKNIRYKKISYSQEGEDIVLERIFGEKPNGFYIDIGAHHPIRFSNTYLFYKKGWRGINIDPLPGMKKLFDKKRKGDVNLQLGISNKKDALTYYMFNEPALNTLDRELSEQREKDNNNYYIIDKVKIKTIPLKTILDKYLPENTSIDFLSIDVEGKDFEVLKSNDWEKYKPKVVLIETLKNNLIDTMNSVITEFLKNVGYLPFAKTYNTVFYMKK